MTHGDLLRVPPDGAESLPRLAPGTELLGQYQDSAYQDPRYLVRRADGQIMQLPRLLYRIVGSLDGRDADQVAADVGAELGRELTAGQVAYLVEDRLRPVGLLAAEDPGPGAAPSAPDQGTPVVPVRSDPLLALRYRAAVIPASVAARVAGFFRPLFHRPVWITCLAAFVAVDVWIATHQVLSRFTLGIHELVLGPVLILAVLGLTIASAAFHECGHASACRYGGARVGELGVGLYVIWPAFYCKVTDSYRLDRVGRVRTDLGGVYFNVVFMTGLGLAYAATGSAWLLPALIAMHVQTAWQFLPSLRLDGYYILADLVGVPDLFGFVRPALLSAVPGRPRDAALDQLKPAARRWIRLWVLLVVPTLLVWVVVFLVAAPRVLPAAWRAGQQYVQQVDAAARGGDVVTTTLGALQLLLLALPWVGIGLILWSLLRVLARRVAGHLPVRGGAVAGAALRRTLALAAPVGVGALVVLRVAAVSGSHPATRGETRLVDSALAGMRGEAGPLLGTGDWPVRLQLLGYARLTGAFGRHASVLTGARELAVLATAVLVGCMLGLSLTRRLRPVTVALTLAVVLTAGPALTVLATVGPGIVGAAWTAAGVLLLSRVRSSAAAGAGTVAVAIGVGTEPLIALPLAAGLGVVLGARTRDGRPARRPSAPRRAIRSDTGPADPRRWLAALVVLPVGAAAAGLAGGRGTLPLDGPERAVLLLLLGAVVLAALLLVRESYPPAAVAVVAVLLAVPPWQAAGPALAVALAAVVPLGALVVDASVGTPLADRTHPLLRITAAVAILLLTVVAGLFQPRTVSAAQQHSASAQVIPGRTPATPVLQAPTHREGGVREQQAPSVVIDRPPPGAQSPTLP